jgi:hypothetical protein
MLDGTVIAAVSRYKTHNRMVQPLREIFTDDTIDSHRLRRRIRERVRRNYDGAEAGGIFLDLDVLWERAVNDGPGRSQRCGARQLSAAPPKPDTQEAVAQRAAASAQRKEAETAEKTRKHLARKHLEEAGARKKQKKNKGNASDTE